MLLILQDASTSEFISEMEADFVPAIGETFIYHEGLPDEVYYVVAKKLTPNLVRAGVKVIRLRVRTLV